MTLEEFKDWLFELLNDSESDLIADIEADEKTNTFRLRMIDGSVFEITCRKL